MLNKISGKTENGTPIVSGEFLFKANDTFGVPLSISIQQVYELGLIIDWIGIIVCARKHRWWDFQTYSMIENAIADCPELQTQRQEILKRIQKWILLNPLDR